MGMIGFGKSVAASALCLTVFGFTGAWAEPLAFPEALGFGANVTNGSLVVQNVSRETSLNLFNALGHRVMNVNLTVTGESRVSLVHLPKGTYFAVLKSAENVQKMKVQVK